MLKGDVRPFQEMIQTSLIRITTALTAFEREDYLTSLA